MISFTIDWLRATFHGEFATYFLNEIGASNVMREVKVTPQFGYDEAVQFERGVNAHWSKGRPEMGVSVDMSGNTLQRLAEYGVPPMRVLGKIAEYGGRVSRVDLAIDIKPSNLTLESLKKSDRKPYKGKGRTPKYTPVGDAEDGWTIYIGARTSDKFLRIYDKKRESKSEGEEYTRIELELKGRVAHKIGRRLADMDILTAYDLASTIVRTMVDFNNPHWEAALSQEAIEFTNPQRNESDTMGWLLKTAAPSLARVMSQNNGGAMLAKFLDAVSQHCEELKAKGARFSQDDVTTLLRSE